MKNSIPALLPRGEGRHFLLYGDSCSGVPGGPHERPLPPSMPSFVACNRNPSSSYFFGDEIIGLTSDAESLREQWRHWLETEMAWVDHETTPLWHTTSNHTTYDATSEGVFRDVVKSPHNGPPGQAGLSYFVRQGDLLLVFVHTSWSRLGGEGHLETEWLETTLGQHRDARHKLVLGHHPVFPVNGFSGAYQREIGHEYAGRFWDILVSSGVLAYLCSHILAFDVQVHRGVLQICTAGAGTAHRMPEGVEYLHCVQAALDEQGLRYQVLDIDGVVRESLEWPFAPALDHQWRQLPSGQTDALFSGHLKRGQIAELHLKGRTPTADVAAAQTIFSAFLPGSIAALWLGVRGPTQTLILIVHREPGRSPSYWLGPDLAANENFDIHVALFPDMGPGGVLYRHSHDPRWSSFMSATATGLEQLDWPPRWSIGRGQSGMSDCPYLGSSLSVEFLVR